jgi:hypothetical protein
MSIDKFIAIYRSKSKIERKAMRENAERQIATGKPAQAQSARQAVNGYDEVDRKEGEALAEKVRSTPMAARVAEAFRKRPPNPGEENVIRALLDNPQATSNELSRAYGHDSQIWQMHFGNMAKAREADLWPAEPATTRDGNFYCGILADFDPNGSRFTMKPEVVEGFAALGIAARPSKRSAVE